jgi:predicted phosphodiesterase
MTHACESVNVTGPLLVFGGPYSNLEATEAMLAEARRRRIPARNIICTGDLVAYCADPQDVVDRLREADIRIVMGNCEESLAASAADCGCGFAEDSACAIASSEWYAYADRHIDTVSRAWMAKLPRRLDIECAGRRLAVVHGGITQINRFVFASSDQAIAEELAAAGCDGVLAGHCGLPFTSVIDGRLWHNAGTIGMPANDGTPRVWYSLLTPTDEGIRIEHHALDYDHLTAAAKMRQRGLLPGYAAALESGLWPSCDVLTPAEITERGRPIEPAVMLWRTSPPATGRPRFGRMPWHSSSVSGM